jgi:DNA-binding NarL/FixJ family response regulator
VNTLSHPPLTATVRTMADEAFPTGRPPRGARDAPVRVLAVDDQAIFLRALRQLIGAASGFELAGEATSGPEALALAAELRPDLALVDVRMPGMDGVEIARRLRDGATATVVVLISLEPLPEVDTVLELGVAAFLRKQELSIRTLKTVWAEHRPRAAAEPGG